MVEGPKDGMEKTIIFLNLFAVSLEEEIFYFKKQKQAWT